MSEDACPVTFAFGLNDYPCRLHAGHLGDHELNNAVTFTTEWAEQTHEARRVAEKYACSREWAEAFLDEWRRPYFGEDAMDAVACVQRAATAATTRATQPGTDDA